jgi:hypothetical protein
MLAFLKYIPFLAKLGSWGSWFAPLAAFIPGGQIGLAITTFFGWIAKAFGWLVEDIVALFTTPKRFVFAAFLVGLGAWFAADWYRERVSELNIQVADLGAKLETATSLNKKWEQRYDAEKVRAHEADLARLAAEEAVAKQIADEEKVAVAAAKARAAAAKRVRDGSGGGSAPAKGPEKASESGVWGLPKISW